MKPDYDVAIVGARVAGSITASLRSTSPKFERFRLSSEASFAERVVAHPGLADRYAAARPDSRLLGSGPKDAVLRTPVGPGWALVGDACLHQDPWTGLGMDNAAIEATLLAESVVDWLMHGASEAAAFDAYRRRRDEAITPGFDDTAAAGRDLSGGS